MPEFFHQSMSIVHWSR